MVPCITKRATRLHSTDRIESESVFMASFPRGGDVQKGNVSSLSFSHNDELFGTANERQGRLKRIESKSSGVKRKSSSLSSSSSTSAYNVLSSRFGTTEAKQVTIDQTNSIDRLRKSSYIENTISLGYVLQVNEDSALISLPGGLTGMVEHAEISDYHYKLFAKTKVKDRKSLQLAPISDLLSMNQPVRCFTLGLRQRMNSKKQSLMLSLRSSLINRGVALKHLIPGFGVYGNVSSKEDHGYIISTGISGVTCFVSTKHISKDINYSIGRPIECVVDTVNEAARTVAVKATSSVVSTALTVGSNLTLTSIIPGMLVNVIVEKIFKSGLMVSFFGVFTGVIDSFNLYRASTVTSIDKSFSKGAVLAARIVFVDYGNKTIRLSLRPHVIEFRGLGNLVPLGESISDLQIVQCHKKIGVLAAIVDENDDEGDEKDDEFGDNNEANGTKAEAAAAKKQRIKDEKVTTVFIHKSSLLDRQHQDTNDFKKANPDDIEKQYKVGKSLSCRVIGYHLVEGYCLASTMSSKLEGEEVITHSSQIHVGQILDVKIISVKNFGLVLQIGEKLQGVCPSIHTSDSASGQNLQKRFKVSQKLKMKVWEVDGNQILLTNKKSLIECDESSCIYQYSDVKNGLATLGVISKISELGIQIHFFNQIKGLVPMSVLVKQGVNDPDEAFRIGQIAKCVVLSSTHSDDRKGNKSRKAKPKIILSLDLGVQSDSLLEDIKTNQTHADDTANKNNLGNDESLPRAAIVSGTIIKVNSDQLNVRLDDGRLAVLERFQLCDFSIFSVAAIASSAFKVGSRVNNAMVLSDGKAGLMITLKPLLLSVAADSAHNQKKKTLSDSVESEDICFPSSMHELLPGQVAAGYILKVESYGVLIKFRNSLTAFAPRPNIADKFTSTAVGMFNKGDSIRCVIQRIDAEKDRIIVTLKSALVPPSSGMSSYLGSYLKESYIFSSQIDDWFKIDWREYPLGSVVDATVTAIKDYGVVLMADDNTTMMLASHREGRSAIKMGSKVKVRILDIDIEKKVLNVHEEKSCTAIMSSLHSNRNDDGESSLVDGRILLVKDKYLVVLTYVGVGYMKISDYHCPYLNTEKNESYKVGGGVSLEKCGHAGDGDFPHASAIIYRLYDDSNKRGRKETARLQKEADKADSKLHDMHVKSSSLLQKSTAANGDIDIDGLRRNFLDGLRTGGKHCWVVQNITVDKLVLVPEHNDLMNLEIIATAHVSCAIDEHEGFDDLEKNLDSIKEGEDRKAITSSHPFARIRKGFKVWCKIMQVRRKVECSKSHGDTDDDENDHSSDEESVKDSDDEKISIEVQLALLPKDNKSLSLKQRSMLQWKGRDAVKLGGIYAAAIIDIFEGSCVVALSPYVMATLNYLDVSNDMGIVRAFRKSCFLGQRIVVAVISSPQTRGKTGLIVSRSKIESLVSGASEVDLSNTPAISINHTSMSPKVGQIAEGYIEIKDRRKFTKDVLELPIFLKDGNVGRLCVNEAADVENWKDMTFLGNKKSATIPSVLGKNDGLVKCKIMRHEKHLTDVSIRPSRLKNKVNELGNGDDVDLPEEGSLVKGYVINTNNSGCFIRLSKDIVGRVLIKDLSDDFIDNPSSSYPTGKLVSCRVLSVSSEDKTVSLSMKESLVGEYLSKELSKLSVGQVVEGHVKSVADFGIFVDILKTTITGLSRRENAVNRKVEDMHTVFAAGDLVKAKILSISGHKISLGLKPSFFSEIDSQSEDEVDQLDSESESVDSDQSDELESNEDMDNEDKEDSDSHNEDDDDDEDNDSDDGVVGDDYTGGNSKVLEAVDDDDFDEDEDEQLEGNALLEKLKREYNIDDDDLKDMSDEDNENTMNVDDDSDDDDVNDDSDDHISVNETGDDDYDDEEIVEKELDKRLPPSKKQKKTNGSLTQFTSDSFIWDDFKPSHTAIQEEDNSDDDMEEESDIEIDSDEDSNRPGKKRSRQKELGKKIEEEKIRKKENALREGNLIPETPADFERMLVGEPNSSYLWIQYMAHHLKSVDIDSARKVAERALRTIGFREEGEKYNMWVAYINLEHKFGNEASLDTVFKRGVVENKGKYLHLNLAEVYFKANDFKNAEVMYEKALKKYKKSKKVWIAYQHYRLRTNDSSGAKALLGRSMQSLSRHKHVEVVTKYAIAEFEFGSKDRGRVVFEDMLTNFPKRIDLWHVYVDQEVKHGNTRQARGIFERMVTMKTSTKSMKAIFKKFIAFEVKHGNKATQDECKQKMKEYVANFA